LATPNLSPDEAASKSWPLFSAGQGNQEESPMVLTISDEEFVRMKTAAMDGDKQEALRLIKEIVKRLEQQQRQGLKSHLA
jgi:hypothetical protein